jgi:hypothetical protein
MVQQMMFWHCMIASPQKKENYCRKQTKMKKYHPVFE